MREGDRRKKKKKSEGDEAVRAGEGGQQGNLHKATFKMYNILNEISCKKSFYTGGNEFFFTWLHYAGSGYVNYA